MPMVISPTSTASKTHVHDRHLPRFGGPSSFSGSTAPTLVPIERDPKIAKFVNLFEETARFHNHQLRMQELTGGARGQHICLILQWEQ
ncbi:hypothetical protein HDU77_008399 [Chytriomyces hyalinus]|nr:hypothetical protein HDU77_008399 [Chytriomyces hyalinus]